MAEKEMDSLQHHFLSHLIHHQGTPDELVDKVVASAGEEAEQHRHTMHEWIVNLVQAGHLHRQGEGITAGAASRLAYQKMVAERRWDMEGAMRLGGMANGMKIYDMFDYNR